MVEAEILYRRLRSLEQTLAILDKLRRYSLEEFVADPERYGSAERFLQLALEALLDMGSHVVASRQLGAITRYRDIPVLLEDNGFISREQRERWTRVIGFRNILVHDYLEIDRKIVHEVLQNRLDDIADLRDVFARLL